MDVAPRKHGDSMGMAQTSPSARPNIAQHVQAAQLIPKLESLASNGKLLEGDQLLVTIGSSFKTSIASDGRKEVYQNIRRKDWLFVSTIADGSSCLDDTWLEHDQGSHLSARNQ